MNQGAVYTHHTHCSMLQDTHTLTHTDESGGSIHTSHALINHTHTLINQWACTSSELFIHKCSHEHLHVHIHVHIHKPCTYAAAMRHQPYAVCMYLYIEGIHIGHTYKAYIHMRTRVHVHTHTYICTHKDIHIRQHCATNGPNPTRRSIRSMHPRKTHA